MVTSSPNLQQNNLKGYDLFFQFGGQGSSYLPEMTRLYQTYPQLREFFQFSQQTIEEGLDYLQMPQSLYQHGFDLLSWINGQNIPPNSYLTTCSIALPCIHICQTAYNFLTQIESQNNLSELSVKGMTGHSMGFHSAILAALDLKGDAYLAAYRKFLLFVLIGGARCQQNYSAPVLPQSIHDQAKELDGQAPSPMAAIVGLPVEDIQHDLAIFKSHHPGNSLMTLSLINRHDSLVISGYEEDLVNLRTEFYHQWDQKSIRWQFLEVSAPFHSPILTPAWRPFSMDNLYIKFHFKGEDLKVPVYSTKNGQPVNNEDDLYQCSFRLMTSEPLNWPLAIRSILSLPQPVVIDFGPGRSSASFTKHTVNHNSASIDLISVASPKALKRIRRQFQNDQSI